MVLGLGEQVQSSGPQASFEWEKGCGGVIATHEGGNTIDSDNLFIKGATDSGNPKPAGSWTDFNGGQTDASAGDSVCINDNGTGLADGQTIRIVYENPNGDNSVILAKYTYQT